MNKSIDKARDLGFGVEKTGMIQDDMQAFIFNANFDNDFKSDFYDEF